MFSKVTSIKPKIIVRIRIYNFSDLKTRHNICQLNKICIWLNLDN